MSNLTTVAWGALMGTILGWLAGALVGAADTGLGAGLAVGLLVGLATVMIGHSAPPQRTCRDCNHTWKLPD